MMGIYLSHLRNRMANPTTGRLPDENFARELMQLFSIGLQQLNADGTPALDSTGKPIETYSNADVMAMARVFTGWSWGFPDAQLTVQNFAWGSPGLKLATDDCKHGTNPFAFVGKDSCRRSPSISRFRAKRLF